MKRVNVKLKKNRKSNFQGDLEACGCFRCVVRQCLNIHKRKELLPTGYSRRWWRFKFRYNEEWHERKEGTKWLLRGKMSEGKLDKCPSQRMLKKLGAGVIWEGKLILKAHVLGTRYTVIELKAWDASRLDSSFWRSNSRKFMWEISSRQPLQRQISCFPTNIPS